MSNHSFSAKMADESMTSDSSIDSVDDSVDPVKGKAFRKYLNQKRKNPSDAKDTASAAVEETVSQVDLQ